MTTEQHHSTPFSLQALIRAMRPNQWTKNLIVLSGLIFARELFDPQSLLRAIAAFFLFCLLSSTIYLVNDIKDVERDRQHPLKSKRPIAAGDLSLPAAWASAATLGVVALLGSFVLDFSFGVVALLYCALLCAYSFWLKHLVILDVLTIAIGFVLRAVAGAEAIDVEFSAWLLLCTILLALFLGLSKRRHELSLLGGKASSHRKILQEYSSHLLDQMIGVVTASTLMAYALYTMDDGTSEKFGTSYMILTVPFVIYGIFRYLYLVHQKDKGGNPSTLVISDKPILVTVALWGLLSVGLIYF
ncbi:decaprenyl-phosphate phosphoribosyltransferase [candidate division KSB3 bacterium]|uniref:Decaprenyl-phosphate phosphoribosyltransferase n=1 Tax=candidate division KSB3 bacterium TaxID=2044937 RepID=A0A2G6E1U8_9BACT|nr:MAG: decaprenyl-phosphate phosphoribosyltransferase [candidate division KSB3 bacterium]PIE28624.1 MAG: decaprenyl-phosphate phosphoribosyltransferase [candidate division KSB3 bacterium]